MRSFKILFVVFLFVTFSSFGQEEYDCSYSEFISIELVELTPEQNPSYENHPYGYNIFIEANRASDAYAVDSAVWLDFFYDLRFVGNFEYQVGQEGSQGLFVFQYPSDALDLFRLDAILLSSQPIAEIRLSTRHYVACWCTSPYFGICDNWHTEILVDDNPLPNITINTPSPSINTSVPMTAVIDGTFEVNAQAPCESVLTATISEDGAMIEEFEVFSEEIEEGDIPYSVSRELPPGDYDILFESITTALEYDTTNVVSFGPYGFTVGYPSVEASIEETYLLSSNPNEIRVVGFGEFSGWDSITSLFTLSVDGLGEYYFSPTSTEDGLILFDHTIEAPAGEWNCSLSHSYYPEDFSELIITETYNLGSVVVEDPPPPIPELVHAQDFISGFLNIQSSINVQNQSSETTIVDLVLYVDENAVSFDSQTLTSGAEHMFTTNISTTPGTHEIYFITESFIDSYEESTLIYLSDTIFVEVDVPAVLHSTQTSLSPDDNLVIMEGTVDVETVGNYASVVTVEAVLDKSDGTSANIVLLADFETLDDQVPFWQAQTVPPGVTTVTIYTHTHLAGYPESENVETSVSGPLSIYIYPELGQLSNPSFEIIQDGVEVDIAADVHTNGILGSLVNMKIFRIENNLDSIQAGLVDHLASSIHEVSDIDEPETYLEMDLFSDSDLVQGEEREYIVRYSIEQSPFYWETVIWEIPQSISAPTLDPLEASASMSGNVATVEIIFESFGDANHEAVVLNESEEILYSNEWQESSQELFSHTFELEFETGSHSLLIQRTSSGSFYTESFTQTKTLIININPPIDDTPIFAEVLLQKEDTELVDNVDDICEQVSVSVYPNPSSGLVNIEIDTSNESKIEEIKIFDLSGNVVRIIQTTRETEITTDLSDLVSGMYLVMTGNSTSRLVIN